MTIPVRLLRLCGTIWAMFVVLGGIAPAHAQYNYQLSLSPDRTTLSAEHPTVVFTVLASMNGPENDPGNFGPYGFNGFAQTDLGWHYGFFAPAEENVAVAPFADGPIPEVVINDFSGVRITGIDIVRYPEVGAPPPATGPAPYGANELVPVYTFSLTITNFQTRTFNVIVSGMAPRITGWSYNEGSARWEPALSGFVNFANDNVDINVESGPVVTTHPADTVVRQGQPGVFLAAADGVLPLSYQWRKNGSPLTDDGHINGATTDTLIILNTGPDDLASYDVVVTNSLGSAMSNPGALSFTNWIAPTVPIGDPGNAPDTVVMGDGTTDYGSVAYEYEIGMYEVTNLDYSEFLNAVAAVTDPYGIYDTDMSFRAIRRFAVGGGFAYAPISGAEFNPVNFVSFFDAARFCNWLHNGKPIGIQDATTTEAGAYTFSGPDVIAPGSVDGRGRNLGWRWAIAEENEWYKAAYGSPSGVYTRFATQSDTIPVASAPPGPVNAANYANAVYALTPVGSYTDSPSAWGTYDQNGNLREYLEGRPDPNGAYFRVRDGSYSESGNSLQSGEHSGATMSSGEGDTVGFRIVRSIVTTNRGGCCMPTPGQCVDDVTAAECAAMGGSYAGDGTACSSLPCSIPRGACCLPNGACIGMTTTAECDAANGLYQGDGVSCELANCHPIGPIMYINAAAAPGGDGSSWAEAFQNPQDAIDIQTRYPTLVQELWIAAGVYTPDRGSGARNAYFLFRNLRVLGGFAGNENSSDQRDPAQNLTILSGDLAGNDAPGFVNIEENSYRVVKMDGASGPPLLDGFIVVSGNANQSGSQGVASGAGVLVSGDNTTISNCIFSGNSSRRSGAAVDASSSTVVITGCSFSANRCDNIGSALRIWGDHPMVDSCMFSDNLGIAVDANLRPSFVDCAFTGNEGAAYAEQSATPTFLRCSFTGHTGGCIAAANQQTDLTIIECTFESNAGGVSGNNMTVTDCTFRNNTASQGAAAALGAGGVAHFVRTTFENNTATQYGGAVVGSITVPVFEDCSFTGNTCQGAGGALWLNFTGVLDLSSCTFSGNTAPLGGAVAFRGCSLIACGTLGAGDSVYNLGVLSPSGPGAVSTFHATGGYASQNVLPQGQFGGNLELDIGGTTPGADYDVLDCGSAAASVTGGAIDVNLINGFVPTLGQTFHVITSGSFSGAYDFVSAPGLPEGYFFDVHYSASGVDLTVSSFDSLFSFADEQLTEVAGVPTDSTLADIDGDGDLDLLVVYPGQPNGFLAVYRSAGSSGGVWQGFLAPALYPVGADPRQLAVGRFSNDAALDVAVANSEDHSVLVFFNAADGTGTLSLAATLAFNFPRSVAAGTGVPAALYVGQRVANNPVTRYVSDGAGGFTASGAVTSNETPAAIAITDANGDGADDLIVLRDPESTSTSHLDVSIFNPQNQTYLARYPHSLGRGSRRLASGDIDSEGHADFIVSNSTDATLSILTSTQQAPGYYNDLTPIPVGTNVGANVLADFDADNDPDVGIIANNLQGMPSVRIIRNDTPAGQAPVLHTGVDVGFSGVPILMSAGDVSGDGLPDLVVIRTGPRGAGALIATRINTLRPPCRADWNHSGEVNSQDFFDFLNAFFNNDPAADFNSDQMVNSQDFFDFLNAFFAGC